MLSFPILIRKSKADVIPVDYAGAGNFLPEIEVPFIMTNASVIFNIDAHAYHSRFDVNFEGNYTIFNPNVSETVLLAAPFSSEFKDLESSCLIRIDNNTISYSFIEYTWENFSGSPWEQYVSGYYRSPRKFIIINVTFPENDSITIEYSFNAYIDNPANNGNFEIFYDVGTSRAWNGSITEQVEFKVYGKQPDSYSGKRKDGFDYNFTISDIEDGMSYVWQWENEIIIVDTIYISYSYFNPWFNFLGRLVPFLIIGGFFLLLIILLYINHKRKKTKRDFNHFSQNNNNNKN
jgi:hypothetical protein